MDFVNFDYNIFRFLRVQRLPEAEEKTGKIPNGWGTISNCGQINESICGKLIFGIDDRYRQQNFEVIPPLEGKGGQSKISVASARAMLRPCFFASESTWL